MIWILRRTGAANLFNSLNNNCNTQKANNGNNRQEKNVKRPPRKAYGRLNGDSDDAASMNNHTDDPFDEMGNYDMITSAKRDSKSGNLTVKTTLAKACPHKVRCNTAVYSKPCNISGCTESNKCTSADCEGNFIENRLCDLDDKLCSGSSDYSASGSGIAFLKSSSSSSGVKPKEINQDTINHLQAMAMSDDDDYDESLTCNVCDRAFHCHRQLASHQQKKRHFGCGGCDSLFPSLMLLEHHKEEFEHWTDDEDDSRVCCRRNRGDDYFTDTDSFSSDAESEDLERLL